ncbi:AGE family epimerase/isomerase [Treponema brennaborense]|uniref:N-acylglucosamine 2-epimerase n=1 Tax=Treponema brennaborense (strain DSM 12168 / CIP 105900 / DD5/3) TaxID=906968 RepID=F4LK20_TREBD|nr:AGE family epimerase/isomerase [Treponema brennaborense]AEE17482.1 N-acylglucosamine 2-epimerase [Treponema brennaborense DSM 12168]
MKNAGEYKKELSGILRDKLIPFWLERAVDSQFGGYLTSFDENGELFGELEKNIVTQSRMVWGFSNLIPFAREQDKATMKEAAAQGARFLTERFWDPEFGGFYWLLNRDASVRDPAKLTYGQSFAIYALSEYYLMSKDVKALEYACRGFDCLQKYATDTLRGGYYENIERNWKLSPAGDFAGDRKSLDIHMHLLEAYTTLYLASGESIHARKLREVYDLIVRRMVNAEKGYGYNQFDLDFNKLPAINIKRTWNAEREAGEKIDAPTDTTSYGHNTELSWLADLALTVLNERTLCDNVLLQRLLDHALTYGYDYEFGGVYRDGVADRKALVYDKEWWQNFESMTGFLNGYILFGDEKYFKAFAGTWDFIHAYFMNHKLGESRQLLSRSGVPLISNLGNPWKGMYHTGRALAECIKRLDRCK